MFRRPQREGKGQKSLCARIRVGESARTSYRRGMIIPFYGAENRDLFAVERDSMDRQAERLTTDT